MVVGVNALIEKPKNLAHYRHIISCQIIKSPIFVATYSSIISCHKTHRPPLTLPRGLFRRHNLNSQFLKFGDEILEKQFKNQKLWHTIDIL